MSQHPRGWGVRPVPAAGAPDRRLSVTFGVWVRASREQLHGAFAAWWSPDYPQLVLSGELGNALPGWGLLGAPVRATVLDPEHTPTCTSSDDEQLAAVLEREWEHDEVLAVFD